ncbi:MAG: helix-hairpin-helix domain-containing protein [Propionibacteriaceae bacterium]|nr:helix-hairpin-helix domain-containing protein [Propionibacteriaceae bacterium]
MIGSAALVLTGWVVLRARTWTPEATALVTPQWSVEATPQSSAERADDSGATAEAEQPWLVHVLGAVAAPGLVSLAPGARVADAIAAAGGLTAEADPGELNLAAELADGAQVVIGTSSQPRGEVRTGADGGGSVVGATSGTGPTTAVIDLNRATLAELETLPNVGPVTAAAILAWRETHGRFTTVAELQEVDGIGPKTYAQLASRVSV